MTTTRRHHQALDRLYGIGQDGAQHHPQNLDASTRHRSALGEPIEPARNVLAVATRRANNDGYPRASVVSSIQTGTNSWTITMFASQ